MRTILYDYIISLLLLAVIFGSNHLYFEYKNANEPMHTYGFISGSGDIDLSVKSNRFIGSYKLVETRKNPMATDFLEDSAIWIEKNKLRLYQNKTFEESIFLKDSLGDDYIIHAPELFSTDQSFSQIYWINGVDTVGKGRYPYTAQIVKNASDTIKLVRKNLELVYQGELWLSKD